MRFISPIIASKLNEIPFKDELTNLSSFKTFALAVLFRITLITTPCSVGEDIAPQVLSASNEGIDCTQRMFPKRTDLSLNEQNWMLDCQRCMDTVAWIILGFFSKPIHLSLFVLSIAAGAG